MCADSVTSLADLKETAYENVDWIHLTHDRVQWALVNTVLKLRVSYKAGNYLTS
jgi:hypothetical protein